MRFYSITNMYLSDIQKGIQTAHAVAECSLTDNALYGEWAEKGKTIIVLNGGYTSNLKRMANLVSESTLDGVAFNESEEALDGALTVVGVVVPERFYVLGDYAKQGFIVSTPTENEEGSEGPTMYRITPSEKLEADEESLAKLNEQLTAYGDYTEADIILINELGNLRLA